MRSLLASVLLAAAAAAQPEPCAYFNAPIRFSSDWFLATRVGSWNARYYQHIEFVPFAGGIAALLVYWTPELFPPYGEPLVWDAQGDWCTDPRPDIVGVWWDDQGFTLPGDVMRVGGVVRQFDLYRYQTGTIFGPRSPHPGAPSCCRCSIPSPDHRPQKIRNSRDVRSQSADAAHRGACPSASRPPLQQ